MQHDSAKSDAAPVSFSPSGLFLCLEPCRARNECRNGVLAAHLDGDDSVVYQIECPDDFRQMPGRAHASWTAGVMSEICGQATLRLGMTAFTGTVTTRYQAPVPVGERLTARVTIERRDGRKILVTATLVTSAMQNLLATAETIMVAAE